MPTENYQSLHGQQFIFHLFNEDQTIRIGLSSNYVYAPVNKSELKDLAEFILNYLEQN